MLITLWISLWITRANLWIRLWITQVTLLNTSSTPIRMMRYKLDITPERAGWKLLGFQVYGLGKGETYEANSGGNELCLVFLGGDATVKVGGETWHIKGAAQRLCRTAVQRLSATRYELQRAG